MLSGNNHHPASQPVPPWERHTAIDVIRGLALFCVLAVNAETLFRAPLLEHIFNVVNPPASRVDGAVRLLLSIALEFKAVTVCCLLFAAGVAIQSEPMGEGALWILARRFLCRFSIGITHLLVRWNGDILDLYAVCEVGCCRS